MSIKSIDPAGTLEEWKLTVLKTKLGNPDGALAVPVKIEDTTPCALE